MSRLINLFLLIMLSLVLTACGGGGGSSSAVVSGTTYTMTGMSLSPTNISGSSATTQVSVQIKQQNNGVISAFSDATVTFTSSCVTQGKATIGNVLAANGVYSATYTNNGCSGVDTISANATINSASLNPITQNLTITGVVQTIGDLTITAANTNVPADGVTQTAIRIFVSSTVSGSGSTGTTSSTNSTAMSGVTVTFATNKGTLSATTAITDKDGYASVYLISSVQAGQATVTASANGFLRSTSVGMGSLTPPARLIVTADTPIRPNGNSTITALALDAYGQPVANANLIFETSTTNISGGKLLSYSATSNAQGIASVIYQAGALITDQYDSTNNVWIPASDIITVNTTNSISQVVDIRVANITTSDTNPANMTIALGGTDVPADSKTPLLVSATLTNSTNLPLSGVTVNFSSTLGTFANTTAVTDTNGVARAYLTSSTAGTAAITAAANGFVRMSSVNFTPSTNTNGGTTTASTIKLGTYNGSSYTAGTIQAPNGVNSNGTATLTFNLFNNTTPQTPYTTDASSNITLSSNCVLMGKASISTPTYLGNGVYTTTYTDLGCSNSVSNTVTATATINYATTTATVSLPITTATSGGSNALLGIYNGSGYTAGTIQAPNGVNSNGTATLTFNLFNNTTPQTPYTTDASSNITLSSNCVLMGKASISTPTYLGNGVYTTTYTDLGCSNTVSNTVTATATINYATTTATVSLPITTATSSSTIQLGYHNGTTFTPNLIYGGGSSTNIAANSTTTLHVNIWDTTSSLPYLTDVSSSFSVLSQCQLAGKATISTATYKGAGVYEFAYTDTGCGLTNAQNIISATAIINGQNTNSATTTLGTTTVSSANVQIGSCSVNSACSNSTFTQSTLKPAVASLAAGQQTTIDGVFWDTSGLAYYNSLTQVTLSSACATAGKATISNTSATNGQFSAIYQDNGCATTDTITATATINNTNLTASTTLAVSSDTAGSIQFISATPTTIAVKGSGLTEQSTVKFKVFGSSTALPLSGKTVNFSLSTTAGGITLLPNSATTDSNGEVSTIVSSGTTPTPVRVIATTTVGTNTISTQSNALTISTTLPDQPHFSMAADTPNPTGAWDIQGTNTTINVLLADQFSNPPPAGTVVNFRAESGQITPTCSTDANGSCSVTWTTQTANNNPPLPYNGTANTDVSTPKNTCYNTPTTLSNLNNKDQSCVNKAGRVTIMAWVAGSEGFIDNNNDGIFNTGDSFATTPANYANPPVSLNDYFYFDRRDLEPPYLDANFDYIKETGAANSGVPNEYEVPNSQLSASDYTNAYNGVLCSRTSAPLCSAQKSVYLFRNMEIVMPRRNSSISFWNAAGSATTAAITIAGTYKALVQDVNGNTMGDGASISITASADALNLTVSATPPTIDKQAGYGHVVPFSVSRSDPLTPATGSVEITVTSGGVITTSSITVSI